VNAQRPLDMNAMPSRSGAYTPPPPPEQIVIRWLSGSVGIAVLVVLMWFLANDALTVAARANGANVPGGEQARTWDWSAVALSALVISATTYRLLTRSRRPSLPVLWLGGIASVCWSLLAGAASASVFS
jgi:hypothetical protein